MCYLLYLACFLGRVTTSHVASHKSTLLLQQMTHTKMLCNLVMVTYWHAISTLFGLHCQCGHVQIIIPLRHMATSLDHFYYKISFGISWQMPIGIFSLNGHLAKCFFICRAKKWRGRAPACTLSTPTLSLSLTCYSPFSPHYACSDLLTFGPVNR